MSQLETHQFFDIFRLYLQSYMELSMQLNPKGHGLSETLETWGGGGFSQRFLNDYRGVIFGPTTMYHTILESYSPLEDRIVEQIITTKSNSIF